MSPRRVLLDECMPREFARYITGHEVRTVQAVGWRSIKNGDLLRLAQTDFDVFVTADRKLIYQQDPGKFDIAIIVLRERNRVKDLLPLIPALLDAIPKAEPSAIPLVLETP